MPKPWEWYPELAEELPARRELWKPYVYAGTGEDAMPELDEEE